MVKNMFFSILYNVDEKSFKKIDKKAKISYNVVCFTILL